MNNKKLGNDFENEVCKLLAQNGYWVHFITPDSRGAQPFDIIAVKNGKAVAIDCKTCVADSFNISRLEDNQIMSFEKWLRCGNSKPKIMVKHKDKIYVIDYEFLKKERNVKLVEDTAFNFDLCWKDGLYTDQICELCPYKEECSGYDGEE